MSDHAPINFVFTYEDRHLMIHKPSCLDTAKIEVKDLFNLSLEPKLIHFYACLHHLGCDHRSLVAKVTPSSWSGLGPNTHLIITQSSNVMSSSSTPRLGADSRPVSRSTSSDDRTRLISEEATYKTTEVVTKTKRKKASRDEQLYHENDKQNDSPDPLSREPLHLSSLKELPAHPRSLFDRRQKPNSNPIENRLRLPLISPQGRIPLSPFTLNTALVDVFIGRTPDSPCSPYSESAFGRSERSEADKADKELDQGTQLQNPPVQQSQSQPEKWDNLQLMLDSLLAMSPTSESHTPFLPTLLAHPLKSPHLNPDDDDEHEENPLRQNENFIVPVLETGDMAHVQPMVSLSASSSSSYYFTFATPAQGLSYDPSHLRTSPIPSLSPLPLAISTPHTPLRKVPSPGESHLSESTHGIEITESVDQFVGLNSPFEAEDETQLVNAGTRPQVTTENEAQGYLEGGLKFEALEGSSAAKQALQKLRKGRQEQDQSYPQIIAISHRGLAVESKTSEHRVEDIQYTDVSLTKETSFTKASDPLILADITEFGPLLQNNAIETVTANNFGEAEPRAKPSETLSQMQLLRLPLIPKGQIQISVFSINTSPSAPKFTVTIDQSRSVINLMAYISSQPEFSDESEYNSLWLQDPDGNTEREISKRGTIKEAKLQTGDRLRFGSRAKYTSTRRKTRMSVMSKLYKDEDEAIRPMTPQIRDDAEKSLTRPSVAIRKRGTLNTGSLSRRSGLPESPARFGSYRIPPGSVKSAVNLLK